MYKPKKVAMKKHRKAKEKRKRLIRESLEKKKPEGDKK